MMESMVMNRKRGLLKISVLSGRNEYSEILNQQAINMTSNAKLAIIIHLYYTDLWPTLRDQLIKITVPFDLYISVPEEDKNITIEKINTHHGSTNIFAFPNRGRDVLPFLLIARFLQKNGSYQYFLKLHTKKSLHRSDGGEWLASLLNELIPEDITSLISTLERNDTGSIGPESHVVSLTRHLGENRRNIIKILRRITSKKHATDIVNKASLYPFFGGTMFWARLDFIEPIIDSSLTPASFEKEKGQVDGTTAHALERIFGGLLHKITNRKMYTVGKSAERLTEKLYEDKYRHVG